MKEDEILKNRFCDLANKAYQSGQYTFSGFLNMMELDLLIQSSKDFSYITYDTFGGSENCERMMAGFGSSDILGYEIKFPITCIRIAPLLKKFSDDFTHRDFLGALMNLGIERGTIGDIVVKEKEAYLFCKDSIAEYIIENLTKVKHTHVKCSICDNFDQQIEIHFEGKELLVSSLRCDVIIAKFYNLSRSQALEIFEQKKVFVNGKCMENNSLILKEGDVIAVRGYGKFIYSQFLNETKKGKIMIALQVYS